MAQQRYVDLNASGANDGSSPTDAWETMITAIAGVTVDDDIEIAAGTYDEVGQYNFEKGGKWTGIGEVILKNNNSTATCRLSGVIPSGAVFEMTNITIDGTSTASALEAATDTSSRTFTFNNVIFSEGTDQVYFSKATQGLTIFNNCSFLSVLGTKQGIDMWVTFGDVNPHVLEFNGGTIDIMRAGGNIKGIQVEVTAEAVAGTSIKIDNMDITCVCTGSGFDAHGIAIDNIPVVTSNGITNLTVTADDQATGMRVAPAGSCTVTNISGVNITGLNTTQGIFVDRDGATFTEDLVLIDQFSMDVTSSAGRVDGILITDVDDVTIRNTTNLNCNADTTSDPIGVIGSVSNPFTTCLVEDLTFNYNATSGRGLEVGHNLDDNGASNAIIRRVHITGLEPPFSGAPHNFSIGRGVAGEMYDCTTTWGYVGVLLTEVTAARPFTVRDTVFKDHRGPFFYAKGCDGGECINNTFQSSGEKTADANAILSCVVQATDNTAMLIQNNDVWAVDLTKIKNLSEYGPAGQEGTWITNNYHLPNDAGIDPDVNLLFGTSSVTPDADITEWLADGFTTNENVDFTTFSAAQILAEIADNTPPPKLGFPFTNRMNISGDVVSAIDFSAGWTGGATIAVTVLPGGLIATGASVAGTVVAPTGTFTTNIAATNTGGTTDAQFQWTTLTTGDPTSGINVSINKTI